MHPLEQRFFTWAEPIEDRGETVIAFLRRLDEHCFDYLLVGNLALHLYGCASTKEPSFRLLVRNAPPDLGWLNEAFRDTVTGAARVGLAPIEPDEFLPVFHRRRETPLFVTSVSLPARADLLMYATEQQAAALQALEEAHREGEGYDVCPPLDTPQQRWAAALQRRSESTARTFLPGKGIDPPPDSLSFALEERFERTALLIASEPTHRARVDGRS